MKKTAWRFLAAGVTTLGLAFGGSAMAASDQPTLTVVTDPSFVPFESLDPKTGEYVGYDIDMVAAIAERAGFDYNLKTMNFNGIIPALQAGSVDVAIAGITITDERAQKVDFSEPYYNSGLKIMVRADNDNIQTVEDFAGKKVSTKIGSTSYRYLTTELDDVGEVVPYPATSQMYMSLITGNVDAAFYDAPNVMYFVQTKGDGKVKAVGPIYEGQQYGLAFPQGSEWVEPVNEALASMKADGTFTRIYKKWFGEAPPEELLK